MDLADKNRKKPGKSGVDAAVRRGILVELENVAISGRQLVFEACRKVMSSKGMELTACLFSHHGLHPPLKSLVDKVAQKPTGERAATDRMVSDIAHEIHAILASKKPHLQPGMTSIMQLAAEKNVSVGFLSYLDESTAVALAESLGLRDTGVLLAYACEDTSGPRADAWLKLAKQMRLPPSACCALLSSAGACRAALAAKMRSVAVPDAFTAFQDFGGADGVVDAIDAKVVEQVLSLAGAGL